MAQVVQHVIIALVVGFLTSPAHADHDCMAQADMTAELLRLYEERPVATGVGDGGRLLVVYAAPGGATWTIARSRPDGLFCVISAGKGWHTLEPKEPGA